MPQVCSYLPSDAILDICFHFTAYMRAQNIHSEGVCTYIGYKAQHIFPAPDEKDYQMLDDPEEFKRHLEEVNNIISKIDKISEDELHKLCWDKGVIDRSFYVTGAHMCRVIDDKAGKKELTQTLLDGPKNFFETYNSLVPRDEKIGIRMN